MTGGAPILCPDPACDIGMLEDYHPAAERDDVPHDTGYVGSCTEGCGAYYVPEPERVENVSQERKEPYECSNCEASLRWQYRHCPGCGYPGGVRAKARMEAALEGFQGHT